MNTTGRFAHISDLHIGRSARNDADAARLCAALVESDVDYVIATGDLTHRGLQRELDTYEQTFAPLQADGRLISVPGNHDCLGDDVSGAIMPGPRVQSACTPGLYIVRVNSTGPHNRSWLNGHGSLDDDDLNAIDVALDAAPAGHLVVIALHHHVLPMPEEHAMERLSSWLGFIFTAELPRGRDLLARVRGRCDLVLHGHRHVPRGARLFAPPRPMHVFNAGSSTELARVRVFAHNGTGHLLGGPLWLDIPAPWEDADQAFAGGTDEAPALAAPARSAGLRLPEETIVADRACGAERLAAPARSAGLRLPENTIVADRACGAERLARHRGARESGFDPGARLLDPQSATG